MPRPTKDEWEGARVRRIDAKGKDLPGEYEVISLGHAYGAGKVFWWVDLRDGRTGKKVSGISLNRIRKVSP